MSESDIQVLKQFAKFETKCGLCNKHIGYDDRDPKTRIWEYYPVIICIDCKLHDTISLCRTETRTKIMLRCIRCLAEAPLMTPRQLMRYVCPQCGGKKVGGF